MILYNNNDNDVCIKPCRGFNHKTISTNDKFLVEYSDDSPTILTASELHSYIEQGFINLKEDKVYLLPKEPLKIEVEVTIK